LEAQLPLVEAYADLREDRASEILAQLTPPVAFWSSVVHLHPDRTRWTIEFLEAALRFANWVEMRFKHALACRRPVDLSPQIQPMILTPGHSTLPSGHATEAFMVAYLLWRLLRAAQPAKALRWGEQLMRQANRIAVNRTIAGVHFPIDSAAGQFLGLTLAEYIYQRCQGRDRDWRLVKARRFDAERFNAALDFQWRQQYDTALVAGHIPAAPYAQVFGAAQQIEGSTHLRWLWREARRELLQ
jgi:membrane-associated phospholipid phosphatase